MNLSVLFSKTPKNPKFRAIIAIDTLDEKIPFTGIYILSTYFIALFLVVQGYICHGFYLL